MGAARAALIEELAREIVAGGARRVAVDGFDGAGKTHLADELAATLGPVASRVRVDAFLNPPEVRHARGRDSPEGFFLDSFDDDAFRAARGDGFGDADPAAPSNRRYVEGQRLYVARCSPRERATVVIDNTDLDAPRRVSG